MDTSPEYIKQCEQAKEIQKGWRKQEGDVSYSPFLIDSATLTRDVLYSIWLPRQDELQAMIVYKKESPEYPWMNTDDLLDRFYEWYKETGLDTQLTSMEQLWMAFTMKENYGKVWSTEKEDWVLTGVKL